MVQLRKTRECVDKMEHVCFWGKLVIMIEITSWWHLFKNYETMEKLEMCNWGKLCMPRVLKIFHVSFVMCDVKDTSYLWNWGKPVVSKHHRNWAQLRKIKSLSVYNLWNLWHNQKLWCALLRKTMLGMRNWGKLSMLHDLLASHLICQNKIWSQKIV